MRQNRDLVFNMFKSFNSTKIKPDYSKLQLAQHKCLLLELIVDQKEGARLNNLDENIHL